MRSTEGPKATPKSVLHRYEPNTATALIAMRVGLFSSADVGRHPIYAGNKQHRQNELFSLHDIEL